MQLFLDYLSTLLLMKVCRPSLDKAVGTADHEEGAAGLGPGAGGGRLAGSPSLSNGKLARLADPEESDELLGKTLRSSGE